MSDGRDEGAVPGLAALREVTPPPSLVPAVMRRIGEPAPPSLWSWLRRRRRIELRLSPLGLGAAALGMVAVLHVSAERVAPERTHGASAAHEVAAGVAATVARPPAAESVAVRFVLAKPGARKVAVAGDFNGWNPAHTPLDRQDAAGTFAATVARV